MKKIGIFFNKWKMKLIFNILILMDEKWKKSKGQKLNFSSFSLWIKKINKEKNNKKINAMTKGCVLLLLSILVLADVSTAIKKEVRRKKLPSDPSQMCGIKSGEVKKSNAKNIPPGPYRRS